MVILNLGAGKKLRSDAVNVDIVPYVGIDERVDLGEYPWPWKDESVDGVYASHILEHFPDQEKFIGECYRILKPGGFLRFALPHSSCISSVGCFGHFRTFSYNTLREYLSEPIYLYVDPPFKTTYQQLRWWYEDPDAEGNLPKWCIPIIRGIDWILNKLIAISPRLFENVFCSFIQCREVIWMGEKI